MPVFNEPVAQQHVTLIVDFSNFCHTCWWPAVTAGNARENHQLACFDELCRADQNPCLKCPPKYDTNKVFANNIDGKLGTISKALRDLGHDTYNVLYVEDNKATDKYELYPEYKAGRNKENLPPLDFAKNHIIEHDMDSIWVESLGNEADDAIATLVKNPLLGPCVIASSDKDLWQLLQPGKIDIFRITKNCFVSMEDVAEEFGVHQANQIPLVKALWGDKSDNIPNIAPRMQKQFMPHVQDVVDLRSFIGHFDNFGSTLTKKAKDVLQKIQADGSLERNWKLVKLKEDVPLTFKRAVLK